jgi:hypothetical protein
VLDDPPDLSSASLSSAMEDSDSDLYTGRTDREEIRRRQIGGVRKDHPMELPMSRVPEMVEDDDLTQVTAMDEQ